MLQQEAAHRRVRTAGARAASASCRVRCGGQGQHGRGEVVRNARGRTRGAISATATRRTCSGAVSATCIATLPPIECPTIATGEAPCAAIVLEHVGRPWRRRSSPGHAAVAMVAQVQRDHAEPGGQRALHHAEISAPSRTGHAAARPPALLPSHSLPGSRPGPQTVSTILPICSPLSISRCAAATSDSGNTLWITGGAAPVRQQRTDMRLQSLRDLPPSAPPCVAAWWSR